MKHTNYTATSNDGRSVTATSLTFAVADLAKTIGLPMTWLYTEQVTPGVSEAWSVKAIGAGIVGKVVVS